MLHQSTRLQLPKLSNTKSWIVCARRRPLYTAPMATTATSPQQLINNLNYGYEQVHRNFEHNFWATKMGLKGANNEELARTKSAYEAFLGEPSNLKAVREAQKAEGLNEEQRKVLAIMEKTFKCYITEDPKAKELKEKLNKLEADLASARNGMALGYKEPKDGGNFVKASSVQLRDRMRVSDDEALRKACYEGLRSIGPFVTEPFIEIVKLRNRLAKLLGFEDFYDYKVMGAEGFGKRRLFEIMDDLEARTRPIMVAARQKLAAEKGPEALEPYNMGYMLSGDTEKAMDPYYPFEDAVDVWARTFAALGINYHGSTMTLDLCDREGKYSNGFCHWPQPSWRREDGRWQPAMTNFTSLATPNQVGSGKTALVTLLHEGGHAAHFSNIKQPSPFFAQERAPMSVAYAENQSMFLDAFAGDAAWLGRYARNREGQPIPWDIIKAHKMATSPYEVFGLRAMLAVPYFEKALYEMPEDQLTVEAVRELADRTEQEVQGGFSPRPLLSVPHILADESSCYYHGYVLAEMSVHQTRAYFKNKLGGKLVDNPQVGKELAEVYWLPGSGAPFLDLVEQLTGAELKADAWVDVLQEPLEKMLEEERADYEVAVNTGPAIPPGSEPDLGMRVRLVHGDELISDSNDGGLANAVQKFKAWVRARYFG
ncbi:oligoendopeptidase [Dunaliella salina]|uniref:Oligoendopeptidase n=1 Tax=Dunaliella salina TaxID=3046 RepID=A0ABQ7G0X1_DUNSA|nr:oligoendopeptidase [Dunaliella salina]|eukprot:KAF5828250.1 oligoendopeptidase [Dunaliella salina]